VTTSANAPDSPSPGTAEPETPPVATDASAALPAELEAARAEIADLKDRFLRAMAEHENIRRRAENDVASARKYAIESFAGEVLSVRDSLDLARSVELAHGNAEAVQKMYEGIELTLKLMDSVLAKFGITLVDPQGEKFDPARHQAISMVATGEVPPNHVVSVVQKGYLLKDRLLRPAMVVVARAPEAAGPSGNA
jgi:molecular chaperone GrpE